MTSVQHGHGAMCQAVAQEHCMHGLCALWQMHHQHVLGACMPNVWDWTYALQAGTHFNDSNGQSHTKSECIAGIADLPGSFAEQADPVNPFTLFGNTR